MNNNVVATTTEVEYCGTTGYCPVVIVSGYRIEFIVTRYFTKQEAQNRANWLISTYKIGG